MQALIIILAVLVGYLVLVLIVGRQLAFNDLLPKEKPNKSKVLDGFDFKNVQFKNHDGKALQGWFILGKGNTNNKTLFILHGWTRTRLKYIDQIKFFVDSGYHVFAYDQLAHGDSDKGLVTFGESEGLDLILAVEFSKSIPEINQDKLGVVGFSLGTGTAIFAAALSDKPIFKAMILEGAFATSFDVGETILVNCFGKVVGKFVGRAFFTLGTQIWSLGKFKHADTAQTIAKIKGVPIMIIRGKNDALVPPESAEKLIKAANEPVEVWIHEQGRHTKAYSTYPTEY